MTVDSAGTTGEDGIGVGMPAEEEEDSAGSLEASEAVTLMGNFLVLDVEEVSDDGLAVVISSSWSFMTLYMFCNMVRLKSALITWPSSSKFPEMRI